MNFFALSCLISFPGVTWFSVDLAEQRVVADTSIPTAELKVSLETTGLHVIVRGMGASHKTEKL